MLALIAREFRVKQVALFVENSAELLFKVVLVGASFFLKEALARCFARVFVGLVITA